MFSLVPPPFPGISERFFFRRHSPSTIKNTAIFRPLVLSFFLAQVKRRAPIAADEPPGRHHVLQGSRLSTAAGDPPKAPLGRVALFS